LKLSDFLKNFIMKKLLIAIIGILILSTACSMEGEDRGTPGYLKHTGPVVNYNEDNELMPVRQFETRVRGFYDFSQRFFTVWDHHVEDTAPLLEKFNDEHTTPEEKIEYSRVLGEKYREFRNKLLQINPPPEASRAYGYALDSVAKRILFFEEFEKGATIDKLITLRNEAYQHEALFWEEIDRIYDHFEQLSKQLKVPKDEEALRWI
jgi:hypothetical protein